MKYIRYRYKGKGYFGELEADVAYELEGDPLFGAGRTGVSRPLVEVELLAPYMPGKIIGVGANYRSFLDSQKMGYPVRPRIFQKPRTAVIGPGEAVQLPDPSHQVSYEGELAVVIGKRCSKVKREEAMDYVFGYSCINDITDRTIVEEDGIWARGKGCDTFAPLGPVIDDAIDPESAMLETRLNGEVVQQMSTADMHFHIPALLEFISTYITLEPGDIIATGTPAGTGCLHPGDMVEIRIEGIGSIANPVAGPAGAGR